TIGRKLWWARAPTPSARSTHPQAQPFSLAGWPGRARCATHCGVPQNHPHRSGHPPNEDSNMVEHRAKTSFFIPYLVMLVVQIPVWLVAGLCLCLGMIVVAGFRSLVALIGGIQWGTAMWIFAGNLLAIGFAWRRSATFPIEDRTAFREAVEQACRRSRHIFLS